MSSSLPSIAPFLLAGLALACGSVNTTKLPNGGYRITCEKGMPDCVSRADKICGGKGYTVVRGRNATEMLGGSSSSYQAPRHLGELELVCGQVPPEEVACRDGQEETVHAIGAPASSPAPPAPARACTPGATQACVGPGACSGGQVCAADGASYGACDCGPAASAPPAAAPQPVAPAPSPPAGNAPRTGTPAAPKIPGAAPPAEPLGL